MPANIPYDDGFQVSGPVTPGPLGRSLKTWWNFEDFVSASSTSADSGYWHGATSGAGSNYSLLAATAVRPGIRRLTTGTTTTGYSQLSYNNTEGVPVGFLFGAGVYTIEADIYIATLSDGTDTYTTRFGFGDHPYADQVDGSYFEYTDTGSTPNWYKCTASNSTRTKTDTTVAVVAGAWTCLKIVVNSAGTSVEYFINGVSVGVVTTNIPTGTGRETGTIFHIVKSAGTTSRTADVDWAWLHIDLTTSR